MILSLYVQQPRYRSLSRYVIYTPFRTLLASPTKPKPKSKWCEEASRVTGSGVWDTALVRGGAVAGAVAGMWRGGGGEVLCWTVLCVVGGKVGCGNRGGMGRWKGRGAVEGKEAGRK